jgi:O-antigen ligase
MREDIPVLPYSGSSLIAKSLFVIYFFFIIFGTSLPFQPPIEDVDDKIKSNLLNQIIFSTAFLLSAVSILNRRHAFALLIKREKLLTLFLIWCFLSIIWSDFRFVSFKRFFQIMTAFTVSAAVLIHFRTSDETLKYFKNLIFLFLIGSLLSIIVVPGAIQPETTAWRGLADGKNHFGQVCLFSSIIFAYAWLKETGSIGKKMFNLGVLILSVAALIGSQSMTSILTAILLLFAGLIFYINREFKTLGIGNLFIFLSICVLGGICVTLLMMASELLLSLPEYVGKSRTFTGRTDLWLYMLDEVKQHPFLGSGFGGFWVVGSENLRELYKYFVWLPNHSHNGYLDILNETGLIGLSLFMIALIAYLKRLFHYKNNKIWMWFVLAALVINVQETTLFRMNVFSGVMFIFSYLAIYADQSGRDRIV